MSNRLIVIVSIVLVVIAGGAYFLTKSSSSTLPAPIPTPTQMVEMDKDSTVSPSESMEASPAAKDKDDELGSVKEITITGSNFKFDSATITVKKCDTVNINFKSSGGFHDFVIDEFDVKSKIIDTGLSDNVEFIASKAGTFEYYCSVGNHRKMGMVGKLIVQSAR